MPQPRRLPQKVSDEKVEQKLENGSVEEDMQSESSDSEDEGDVIYRTVIEGPAGRRLRSQERQPSEESRLISHGADGTGRDSVQEENRQKSSTVVSEAEGRESEEREFM